MSTPQVPLVIDQGKAPQLDAQPTPKLSTDTAAADTQNEPSTTDKDVKMVPAVHDNSAEVTLTNTPPAEALHDAASSVNADHLAPVDAQTEAAEHPTGAAGVHDDNENDALISAPLITAQSHPELASIADRLNRFVTFSNPQQHSYAMSQLPDAALWGHVAVGPANNSGHLCLNNKRINLWVVGTIEVLKFFRKGHPVDKPGVLLKPLISGDLRAATSLLGRLSEPKLNMSNQDGIWITRWATAFGIPEDAIKPFPNVYDATNEFNNKDAMDKLLAADLRVDDIVLTECSVIRWHIRTAEEKQASPGTRNLPWKKWQAELKLNAISLLYRAADDNADIDQNVVL
ncbi:hypothetical protein NM688_g3813 [Phlebia brevispora]|uniref:Uncharacterized protein n=1 Tax=Phlebia brevispora TaxID=194682 RepID=A0ACC1T4X4_9APHY|nr:hypothetical protein NM688_g3813 [Phlebia brevispora]